jgi:hypothetical protein
LTGNYTADFLVIEFLYALQNPVEQSGILQSISDLLVHGISIARMVFFQIRHLVLLTQTSTVGKLQKLRVRKLAELQASRDFLFLLRIVRPSTPKRLPSVPAWEVF